VLLNSTKPPRMFVGMHDVSAHVKGQLVAFKGTTDGQNGVRDALKRIKLTNAERPKHLPSWLGGESPGVAVILDNAYVRVYVCSWDYSLKTYKDFFRFAEIEFERRFHMDAKLWKLVPDRVRPGVESVWCAYRTEQLDALETMVHEEGLTLQSVLPVMMAELASLSIALDAHPTLYVSRSEHSKNVCWIEEGRLRDMMVLKRDMSEDASLIDLFVLRLKSSQPESVSKILVQGSRTDILRSLLLWQPVSTSLSDIDIAQQAVSV
jgi:hypothetical protein